jgi:predicted CoA-binding protein
MDKIIETFVQGKRLAVVGASRTGSGKNKKFGNMAAKELKERGYQVYLIHPEAQEIDGERCYPNLSAVQGQVDGVLISVPPKKSLGVINEAATAGMKNIWLQQGAESTEVLAQAKQLGLSVISGKCILMYAPPVRSFHGFHRFVMKLIGQL